MHQGALLAKANRAIDAPALPQARTSTVLFLRANRSGVVVGAALPQVVLSGYGVFHIGQVE